MKKKFTLEIATPCSENFDKMIAGTSGSFCDSCSKNVIDLSRKTNFEVAKFIVENKDKNICARLKKTQLEVEFEYNEISKINNFKYAAIAATVLIASNVMGQEQVPVKTEINDSSSNGFKLGKIAPRQNVNEEISIVIKGKLLDATTNKPLNDKTFSNLSLTINGSQSIVKVNPETGDFFISVKVLKNSKTLIVTVTADDYYLSKILPFTIESVKDNMLVQNVFITEKELPKVNLMIMGGLGINYSRGKEIKQI